MSGKKRSRLLALAALLLAVAAWPSAPCSRADTFSFSGDSTTMTLAEGGQHALLTGHGRVESQDLRITADSIELFGKDFIYASCHGNVHVVDARRGLDLTSQELFYDRDQKIAGSAGNAIMADVKNEMVVKGGFIEDRDTEQITIVQIGVRIFKKDIVCRSEFARYQRDKKILELSGMPWVSKGGDVYQAARITDQPGHGRDHPGRQRAGHAGGQGQRSTHGRHRASAGPARRSPRPHPARRRASRRRARLFRRPREHCRSRRTAVAGRFSSKGWQRATAACRRCGRSPSAWKAGRWSACSARTARARPRSSTWWWVHPPHRRKDLAEREGHLGPSHVPPRAPGRFLPAPGALGFPQAVRGGQHPGDPGDPPGSPAGKSTCSWTSSWRTSASLPCAGRRRTPCPAGRRRRTEIARSLAIEPKFLLLDEPFAGIDPITVSELKSDRPGAFEQGHRGADHRPQRARHPADHPSLAHHQPGRNPGERDPGRAAWPARSPGRSTWGTSSRSRDPAPQARWG